MYERLIKNVPHELRLRVLLETGDSRLYPFQNNLFAWMTLIVDWRRKTHQVDKKQSLFDRTLCHETKSNRYHHFRTQLVKFHVHKIHHIAFSLHKQSLPTECNVQFRVSHKMLSFVPQFYVPTLMTLIAYTLSQPFLSLSHPKLIKIFSRINCGANKILQQMIKSYSKLVLLSHI